MTNIQLFALNYLRHSDDPEPAEEDAQPETLKGVTFDDIRDLAAEVIHKYGNLGYVDYLMLPDLGQARTQLANNKNGKPNNHSDKDNLFNNNEP